MRNRILFMFALVCFLPALICAQVAVTGKITGVVTDSSGSAVPNATVTVKSTALMSPRSINTGGDGAYLFDLLPPGTYEVTVTAKGFSTVSETGIVITAGFTATANANLKVGEVSEVIKVESEPVVDVQNVQSTTTFDQNLLQDIPSGRDPWSTVAQVPGATISTVDVGGNQSYQQSTMQVHGSTPGEQVFSFNGLDLNWPGANGGYTQFYTDHDSFDEFQVVTDNAPASVAIGGVYMNMVTKSGSNAWHGQGAIYYSSAAFEAGAKSPIFDGTAVPSASPIYHERDTTIGVGGPILKDRLWIFGSYRRYDIGEEVLAIQTASGAPGLDIDHQTNTALRLDWQVNSKNKVGFVWLYNEQNRFNRRDTSFQLVSPDASWVQIEPAYILEGLWTTQISNSLLVDVRFGYNKEVFPLNYAPGTLPTAINQQDLTLSTETGAAPYAFVNPSWVHQFSATASYYKNAWGGTHNFKAGFEIGGALNPYHYTMNEGVQEQFNNTNPVDVLVYNAPLTVRTYSNNGSVFLQDAWTIKRRLTLNLGVRYDRFTTHFPAQSIAQSPFWPSVFPAEQFAASGNIVDWNNVAPRIGAAWDLGGHGTQVVRASYGRYYLMEGTQLGEAVNPVGLSDVEYSWNGAVTASGIPTGFLGTTPIGRSGGAFSTIDPSLSRPYSDEVSVGYERQLWNDLHVGVAYYFRRKGNLIGQLNTAVPVSDYTPITTLSSGPIVNGLTGQPLTLFNQSAATLGQTTNVVTNIPVLDSNRYDGVEFTATKRLSHKFMVLAGFTVQKQKGAFGNGGADEALSDNFNDPNQNINRLDNVLNMDATYVLKIDGTYELPWKFNSSVNFQHYTGYPIRPTETFSDPDLNQGVETVALLPAGQLRYPSVNLLNLRLAREFIFRDRFRLEPIVDLFNLTNAQTVVSENTAVPLPGEPSTYLKPSNTVNPFLARFGLKFSF